MREGNTQLVWFDDLGRGDVPRVGGKNASLGEMVRNLSAQGASVPLGFATTAQAYWQYVEANQLRKFVDDTLREFKSGKASLQETGQASDRRNRSRTAQGAGGQAAVCCHASDIPLHEKMSNSMRDGSCLKSEQAEFRIEDFDAAIFDLGGCRDADRPRSRRIGDRRKSNGVREI